jgi:UDP-glucose 4-epimerase
MKVIISGATGYIGSQMVQRILAQGGTVGAITRSQNKELPYIESKNIDFYYADITKPIDIKLNTDYDVFIHLAAANDIDSLNPETAIIATALGTKNCLDFCKKNNIRKFIYYSTFQVLGKVDGAIDESTIPEPKNDYGITHLFAEEYVKMYLATADIEYIIIRPTNIYGAPIGKNIDRWSLVPGCFCKEAFEENKITLNSSGKQMRDFLNLIDLIEVTDKLIHQFDFYKNKTINVSSDNHFTIIEIAHLVKAIFEKRFQKECKLIVKSEQPLISNTYQINRDLISSLGHQFRHRDTINDEINATFDKLLNTQ